jgi:hypothetical protein
MTVKKAIQILDWWIGHKKETMETLRKEWHYQTYEEATGVAKLLFEMDKIDISNMEEIRKELVPNCTHPKKMRDRDPSGQWYCMNCNLDL